MVRSKIFTIIIHVLGWSLFLSLPLLFMSGPANSQSLGNILLSPHYWLFYLLFICIFYLNTYLLIPFLYLKKKYAYYFFILLLLFSGIYFFRPFDSLAAHHLEQPTAGPHPERPPFPPPHFHPEEDHPGPFNHAMHFRRDGRPKTDIISLGLFLIIISLGMAMRIIAQWRLTEQRAIKAEGDKAAAELSFLKAQINPHFLFNTLNNIYSMAVTKNDNTAPSIMKLSNIMRYVMEEASSDFIALEQEIACIKDYIALQQLRLSKKAIVLFEVTGKIEDKRIAPLLLMTFVENAFKYGVSSHTPHPITININADEQQITFRCQNYIFTNPSTEESTGIGLANTKKRLEHLYPSAHTFHISTGKQLFTVQLTIQV